MLDVTLEKLKLFRPLILLVESVLVVALTFGVFWVAYSANQINERLRAQAEDRAKVDRSTAFASQFFSNYEFQYLRSQTTILNHQIALAGSENEIILTGRKDDATAEEKLKHDEEWVRLTAISNSEKTKKDPSFIYLLDEFQMWLASIENCVNSSFCDRATLNSLVGRSVIDVHTVFLPTFSCHSLFETKNPAAEEVANWNLQLSFLDNYKIHVNNFLTKTGKEPQFNEIRSKYDAGLEIACAAYSDQ